MSPDERPRLVAGRYELLELIGSGGMGVVHRARDRVLDRIVAVKSIHSTMADEEFVRRFDREAAILARLRSPHIVVVYDYGQEDGQFFLVTDFLADGDLAQLLASQGPMAPTAAAEFTAQLAEGLADAHGAGVIHRDIKPANVLLWRRAGSLQPVLADFGIAVTQDLSITATGGVIGSPHFMAPERHLGQAATEATDIYAMGCLLHNVLLGRPPFDGTVFQVANAHLNEPVPSLPPGLAAADLNEIMVACLAKAPEDRIPTAAELARRLRTVAARRATADVTQLAATQPRPVLAAPAAPSPPRDRSGARARPASLIATVLAVVAVVAGATGLVWWLGRDQQGPDRSAAAASGPSTSGPSAPPAPTEAKVDTRRLVRAVGFDVSLPSSVDGVTLAVERKQDAQWVATDPEFEVAADRGSQRVCVTLRLVAVGEGLRTPGKEREVCDLSRKPAMSITRGGPGCDFTDSTRPCFWVNLVVTGLEAGRQYVVELSYDDGRPSPFTVTADANGVINRGPGIRDGDYKNGGLRIWSEGATFTVTVLGVRGLSRTWDVDDYR